MRTSCPYSESPSSNMTLRRDMTVTSRTSEPQPQTCRCADRKLTDFDSESIQTHNQDSCLSHFHHRLVSQNVQLSTVQIFINHILTQKRWTLRFFGTTQQNYKETREQNTTRCPAATKPTRDSKMILEV